MEKCLIDQTVHSSLDELHKYLRKLKVKQEDYYVQYHARKDRFSGEPIPFKNVEQYLACEFVCKDNLRRWIAMNPAEGKKWAINWLRKRRAEKGLTYPPTQVELSSLMCPTIRYYDWIGGYNTICQSLGYKIRFDGVLQIKPADYKYIIDTREQLPLKIAPDAIRAKLNAGDYGLTPEFDCGVYIERKSLADFVGTLSMGHERFVKEIERANEAGSYIIILVENIIENALGFELKHVKVTPAHVFKNLRDILSSFDNVQALFVNGREEATTIIKKLLQARETVKRVDLQYAYETKKL